MNDPKEMNDMNSKKALPDLTETPDLPETPYTPDTPDAADAPETADRTAPERAGAHRRRRTDRFSEAEEAAEDRAETPRQPSWSENSETAREVANRYRQRQEAVSGDRTTRLPSQSGQAREAALREAAGRNERERVGYAPGRMGMSPNQRARMSEAGRARLAAENRVYGNEDNPRNNGLPGRRPVITDLQDDEPSGGRKVLTALVVLLLIIGAALIGLLLIPDDADGPLGTLKQQVTALLNRKEQEPHGVVSFTVSGQDQEYAPAKVTFLIVTEKGAEDVRLLDDADGVLPTSRTIGTEGDNTTWELVWNAAEAYSGSVKLQVMAADQWTETDFSVQVRVLPAEEAPKDSPS